MKICVVKQPYVTEFTWESVRFTSAWKLLDKFILRSQNFSLLAGLRGDVWVVEDGPTISNTYRNLIDKAPLAIEALYESHRTVPWSSIPWHEYDVVLSADQIIPAEIIRQYPDILWCYFEQEHTLPSFAKSAQKPDGAYDLFLNHHLSSPSELKELPQSIAFPYTAKPGIMSELLRHAHDPVVFLDSHMIRECLGNIESVVAEYENKCGLPVKYPRPWDFANSYECVGKKLTKQTSEHLADMAGCRYFLLVRSGGIGQGAIEAASTGLIVISDSNEIYSRLVCHPACFVSPMNYDDALAKVRSIESDAGLQKQIRQFQDIALREHFWDKPIKLLERGLQMKRDRKRASLVHPIDRSNSKPVILKMPSSAVLKRISVIFSGRNDSYGGCFKEKLLAAWKRNSIEFYCRGIEVEWIFVEWNPLNEDYLSYTLAPLGFKCCVVSPSVHREICTNPNMSFMQFFAKNVGIRRATNHWLLITNADCVFGPETLDYIGSEQLDPGVIYRAERRDVESGISSAPFSEMFRRTVRVHDSQGGAHFTEAAGDFVLYNKESVGFGYDESITFSDVHVDGRFLLNWEIKSGVKDLSCFRFIGNVFKEDHPLTFKNTQDNKVNNHKGAMKWNKPLPYMAPANWGLADSDIHELRPNIWYIGKSVEPLEHKEGAENILVKPGDSVEVSPIERHGSEQALPREAQAQAMTIFAMPKAFTGLFATIQRNAIESWVQLRPRPEIILFGNDEGVAEFARMNGLRHVSGVKCNEFGTPLVEDLFERAQAAASNEICVYVNADIILMDDFTEALGKVSIEFDQFLMIGRRWDLDVTEPIEFDNEEWQKHLKMQVKTAGSLHLDRGLDYFAYRKGLWRQIPPFGLGRAAWDNWLVYAPLSEGKDVVDATELVTIVHQNHDFSHVAGGKEAPRFQTEIRRNCELAGPIVVMGVGAASDANWRLTRGGLVRNKPEGYVRHLNDLCSNLTKKGWDKKYNVFKKYFDSVRYLREVEKPFISIVVISWRFHPDSIKGFESLARQRDNKFELIFVNNGADGNTFGSLMPFIDTYVELNQNTGAYLARNVGAVFAKAAILLFLDDDAIPESDIVRAYLRNFEKYDVIAVRGAVWPKDRSAGPYSAHRYYGPTPFPYFSCQEGNSAYRASAFYQVGGWDDEICWGHGGIDLSRRLLNVEPDMRKQMYSPEPVIYHDPVKDKQVIEEKGIKQKLSAARLERKHPDFYTFQQRYGEYYQREDLLILRDARQVRCADMRGSNEYTYPCRDVAKDDLALQRASHIKGLTASFENRETLSVAANADNQILALESFRKGIDFLRNDNGPDAVTYLKNAAANCATLPNVYYALATAYARSGDIFSAQRACRLELSLQPDNRGAAQLLERLDRAADEYRESLVC